MKVESTWIAECPKWSILQFMYFQPVLNHHFTKDCIFPIGPIWTRLSPINQSFDLPDGRPESPPIAPLFLTRLSSDNLTNQVDFLNS